MSFCLTLTACDPDVFYIPINNKLDSAKPLSKTDDTIRVIVPEKITQYIAKAHNNDSDWLKGGKFVYCTIFAKVKRDDF